MNLSDDDDRRQIANLIMLKLLPSLEVNEAFNNIIEAKSNVNRKFLKLTDHILCIYVEEA